MDIVYDVLKTWYLGNQEDKRNKKQILTGFRGLLFQIVTEIDIARVDDSILMKDLKNIIPVRTSEFAKLIGTYEFDMPLEVTIELHYIHKKMIDASNGIKMLTNSTYQEVEDAMQEIYTTCNDLSKVIVKVVTET